MSEATPQVTPEVMSETTPEVTPEVPGKADATLASSRLAVTAFPASVAEASQPVLDWWVHHWMDAAHPLSRLQRTWVESVFEAIEVETDFLNVCALSNVKLLNCLAAARPVVGSSFLHSCYHEVAQEMADAHMARLGRVAELPEDFKQRLWEEIC
ncbi:hypothetical protein [Halomonas lysinitropha]